jgi:DNA-directed RNA polymerase subunit RPC12/RpoP
MGNAFTKIGSYQYSYEAVIVKGKLEAEGIEVLMTDSFTIDTDPMVSNAIGGVKLFVKTGQLEDAQQVLSQVSRYSVDDEGKQLTCPKCGSNETELGSTIKDKKSFLSFLFCTVLFGTLPFYIKYKHRCNACGNEFNIKR